MSKIQVMIDQDKEDKEEVIVKSKPKEDKNDQSIQSILMMTIKPKPIYDLYLCYK